MPIIQGKNVTGPGGEFCGWGLASFRKGRTNVTELHYHDCDEFIFMLEGRILIRSEGINYVLVPEDVLVTRMGDEHEILEILEDTTLFWLETELKGQKRLGHLHRNTLGAM